ncbi:MAG: PEP-CTERM sorting domain-containing protein [Candidatus Schekmanbacteria bacterium]|nr:PEP-CTERM sorting domain-containing protein [Candidatus Schekmanbacteria bacterium]
MKLPFWVFVSSLCFSAVCSNAEALKIEYTATNANPTQIAAFEKAAQIWETKLKNPVTVQIDVDFSPLQNGVIGGTWPSLWYAGFYATENSANYLQRLELDQSSFLSWGINSNNRVSGQGSNGLFAAEDSGSLIEQLALGQTSANDALAVSYLNTLPKNNSNLEWYSNDVLYASNLIIGTSANLKALGYSGFTGSDASMTFNSNFSFDYNPDDGINQTKVDFVGVATHEIGHALGFLSIVDYNAYLNRAANPFPPTVLDLYRHSTRYGFNSIDISYDGRDAWFSHDFGQTIVDFADGINSPSGDQASHWADDLLLGIMDPTAARGELLEMRQNDVVAMDVIGWDVVPEPGSLLLLGSGLVTLLIRRKM